MPSDFSVKLALGIACVCVAFAGCATQIQMESQGDALVRAAGVPQTEFKFVTKCDFGEAPPSGTHIKFVSGVIVITRDSIMLLAGKGTKFSFAQRLPFKEMAGIDLKRFGLGRQLQILRKDGGITVILPAVDIESGADRIRQMVLDHGVRPWTGPHFYLLLVDTPIFIPILKH
jgi:hypothetical protein